MLRIELDQLADKLYDMILDMKPSITIDRHLYSIETIQSYISKLDKSERVDFRIDETLFIVLGILQGQGKIEISRAHGRGVGFFWMIAIQEQTNAENKKS